MKSFTQICKQHSVNLYALLQHQAKLQNITHQFKHCLPDTLAEHVYIANLRQRVLYLHVDSSAWASRARFFIPQLLSCCQQQQGLNEIRSIQLKVRVPEHSTVTRTHKPVLSSDSAELLTHQADLTQYEPLRQALLKLAQHKNINIE